MKKETNKNIINRRHFLTTAGTGLLLASQTGSFAAASPAPAPTPANLIPQPKMKICVFSKHLQWCESYEQAAQRAAQAGCQGLDLTVRPGGHVLPERVQQDLPLAVQAAQKAGIEIPMITTAITDPKDPLTESILKTASQLGIKYYRMGYFKYDLNRDIPSQLEQWKPIFEDLVQINKKYNIQSAYQNHSGRDYLSAPIWDLWLVLKDLDKQYISSQFDIRHATAEGGLDWRINTQLIAPHITTFVAKDFYWIKKDNKWTTQNCPLGQGMVQFPEYFTMVKKNKFTGPVSLHMEYDLGGAEHGKAEITLSPDQFMAAFKKDVNTLKTYLAEANL